MPVPASASQLPEQHSSFLYPYFRSSDFFLEISRQARGLRSSCLFYLHDPFQAHVRSTENGFLQSHYAVNTIIVAEAYGRIYFESDGRLDEDFFLLQSRAILSQLDHVTDGDRRSFDYRQLESIHQLDGWQDAFISCRSSSGLFLTVNFLHIFR